ncbi:MAG: hypothetical protein LBI13_10870 [Streptococcaceae bacterium]|nr:hypothetical protein [Streptococcaceae bacterium]
MLTDRQQGFYYSIVKLSHSNHITDMERENFARAVKWFARGDDFHDIVNSLELGLQALEAERLQGKLSSEVKVLFENLKEAYGEPKKSNLRIGGGAYIRFLGEDEGEETDEVINNLLVRQTRERKVSLKELGGIVRTIFWALIVCVVVFLLIFTHTFTPALSWLNQHLGEKGRVILIVIMFALYVMILIISAKMKKGKEK